MNAKLEKVKAIFLEAIEQPDRDQCDRFLEQACTDDLELRHQVQLLLDAHHSGESLLDKGAIAAEALATEINPLSERPGDTLGPFKLLQQIGEGGMGVVYMAEQTEPVDRRVALKIIKPGMDTQQVIARFEAERQALAMMDHPNIAKVLDAGQTGTGRPYFVMELVKGMPVTQYCDEQHLTPRERLELFIPICQAVQHAHQKGIIHRDLKPSNILIAQYDNKPVPKVIDFGVAKAISQRLTEQTMFTQYGQIVGTLEYMSPEQARFNQLDVDTRSDIYSLGVLLYELLTGETPFDKQRLRSAAFDELLRIIREEAPPKPSTKLSSSEALASTAVNRKMEPKKLSLLVRGELDLVVMKALEKDRNRRYETANAFAADVQRYLTDEPVTACPPSASYRFRKFAQRNRTALNMSAVVAVLLLLAVGSIGWMVRDRGMREEQAVRERADRQARFTSRVSALLEEVGRFEQEQKWPVALATAQRAHAISADGEMEPGVQEEIVRRLRDLEFIARLEDVRLERATFLRAGDFDNSRSAVAYGRAFREFGLDLEQLPPDEAVLRLKEHPQIASPLAVAIDDFAEVRSELSGERDPGYLSLLSIARAMDPDPARDRLRRLLAQPESLDIRVECLALIGSLDVARQFPASLSLLSRALWRAGLTEESLSLLRQAQEHHPDDFWINFELALRLHESEDFPGAIRFYSVAIALRPAASGAHNNLGVVFNHDQRYDEAVACFRRAIELDPDSSIAQYNLGKTLWFAERWAESVEAYQRAIELDHLNAGLYHNLALSQKKLGRIDEAVASLTTSVEFYQRDTQLSPRDSILHFNLASAQFELQRFDDAVASQSRAVELDPANSYAANRLAIWIYQLVKAQYDLERLDDAVASLSRAVDRIREASTADNSGFSPPLVNPRFVEWGPGNSIAANELAASLYNLAKVQFERQRFNDAVVSLNLAVQLEPANPEFLNNAARMLVTSSNEQKLDAQRAVELAQRTIDLSPDNYFFWKTLGMAHYRAGNWRDTITAMEESCRLEPATNGKGNAWQWLFLAMAHWQLGNQEQARKWYERSLDVEHVWPKELLKYRTEAEELMGVISAQELASLRMERWDRELAQLPHDPHWNSARMRLCREIAGDSELYGAVQKLRPDDDDLSIARGQILAQAEKWDEAGECFGRVIERRGLTEDAFQFACLNLLTARLDAYRQFCTKLIGEAGEVTDPDVAFVLARTCILVQKMPASPEQVVSWAEQAVSRERLPWRLHVLGAASCRAGQYDRAIELLKESTASNWSAEGEAQNALVLAIAHKRQGNSVAASECLDRARVLMAGLDRPPPPDWLGYQVLVREAEALIEARP